MDKKIYAATLYPLNKDIFRKWFVKFKDACGKSHKSYGKLNQVHTKPERLKEFKRLLKQLQSFGKKQTLKKNKLIKNLSDALEFRDPTLKKKSYQCYFSFVKGFAIWYNLARAKDRNVSPTSFILLA